jgi:hypothetical protein
LRIAKPQAKIETIKELVDRYPELNGTKAVLQHEIENIIDESSRRLIDTRHILRNAYLIYYAIFITSERIGYPGIFRNLNTVSKATEEFTYLLYSTMLKASRRTTAEIMKALFRMDVDDIPLEKHREERVMFPEVLLPDHALAAMRDNIQNIPIEKITISRVIQRVAEWDVGC